MLQGFHQGLKTDTSFAAFDLSVSNSNRCLYRDISMQSCPCSCSFKCSAIRYLTFVILWMQSPLECAEAVRVFKECSQRVQQVLSLLLPKDVTPRS